MDLICLLLTLFPQRLDHMITIIIYIQGRDLFQNWPSSFVAKRKTQIGLRIQLNIVIYNEATEQTSKLNLCHIFNTVILLKLLYVLSYYYYSYYYEKNY